MNKHIGALEFSLIIEKLKENALSDRAKNALSKLSPLLNENVCLRKMEETTSARKLLDCQGSPPLPIMKELDEIIALADAGAMLTPEQLTRISLFSNSCRQMSSYLARGEAAYNTIGSYGRSVEDLSSLRDEIENCVIDDKLRDDASPALKSLRRKIDHVESQIKDKLSQILQSRKQYLSDGYITKRQGHYVLPVKRKYQSQFGGTAIEASSKGSTIFMEPAAVSKLQAELDSLIIAEDSESRRILYALSADVSEFSPLIRRNMEAMEILDVIFAKAKLSASMNARPVEIGCERKINIKQGRHPLLDADSCVALDFQIDEETNGVIITGPNTGGKTVAVKTVGLLSLMAQCGLHIPCDEGSYIAMHDGYWCDIGDSQNISQNLSTFSGHMTNVIDILEKASRDSLVLLDELGSGTDPVEGMGIAVAVIDELKRRNCMFLVTTHYPQIKVYAEKTQGILSARMAFDQSSLRPLYKLEMGKTGESCALHIAKRLGLAESLLARAHSEAYGDGEYPPVKHPLMKSPKSRLERSAPKVETDCLASKFSMGDSVILPNGEIGIVYRPANETGDVIVQAKGEKRAIKHNRLRLKISAAELYPPDYDFSIIFDTVENRKARHNMGKRHDPNLAVTYSE